MREERVRLGTIDVDSGQLLVIDPCYLEDWDHEESYDQVCELTDNRRGGQLCYQSGAPGRGVAFHSGLGDGTYDVWATVQDDGFGGQRVVRVEIDLDSEAML